MQATPFEFRYRFWIIMAIYVLGFTAPWDLALHLDGAGPNAHVWGLLAVLLSKGGAMSIAAAFNLLLAVAIACAFAGAWLRTWGSAYLGADVMRDMSMRSDAVVADGPYRYTRNPLYVGSWLNLLALALLMPASGAVFAIVGLIAFHLRLIFSEEAFLRWEAGRAVCGVFGEGPADTAGAAAAGRGFRSAAALGTGGAGGDLYVGLGGVVCRAGLAVRLDAAAAMRAGVAGRVAGGESVCGGAGRDVVVS